VSRVFEALSKASQEKKQQAETPLRPEKNTRADVSAVTNSTDDGPRYPGGNGKGPNFSSMRPQGTAKVKLWSEKIEELIFGWDLRRYSDYSLVALEEESPASEQYKMLREQVKRLRTEAGILTFAVSSPVKKDGKTTVAVNLAAALALDYEESVLLIDGDLRDPSVHRYFQLSATPGLADYLSSVSSSGIRDYVKETFLPNLRVLPAGKRSTVASELLAKDKMRQLIEEIRSEFPGHQIIIDSPPILSTPDPMVIARRVDGVLLVVRAGKTPRDYLLKSVNALQSSKIMGVVLNWADSEIASKYYYYSNNGAS